MSGSEASADEAGGAAGSRGGGLAARARAAATPDRLVVAGLAVAAAVASLLVQRVLLPLHSFDLDEGVYLFQARMLREGMLTLPASTHGTFFRPWLSGEADGRIFTEYQVGFPAFLALSEALLGSAAAGLALVAAGSVVTVHGWARALFGDRRTALLGAVLASFSPLAVLHSGLFVTYSLTVLLGAGAGWALLAAVARRSAPLAALSGLAWGGALLVRPLDALIVAGPMAALALVRLRRDGVLRTRRTAALAGALVAGGVPSLLLTAAYNAGTTGSPLSFPNMAADPLNTFGFGTRRLLVGEPTLTYGRAEAWQALVDNLVTVPSWTLGGIVLLVLAAVGAVRRGAGAERLALLAITLGFPLVYVTWWATALSGEYALNGIGPHYYVPSFVTGALLAARGAVEVVPRLPRPRVVGAALLVLGLAATAWAVPDKVADKRGTTASNRSVERLLPDDLADAVVLVDGGPRPFTLSRFPFLQPDPTLTADVLIAAERGPLDPRIVDQFPDRRIYRLRNELRPGDELLAPTGSFRELALVEGDGLVVALRVTSLPPGRRARAVLRAGDRVERVDLGEVGPDGRPRGAAAEVTWRLDGATVADPTSVVVGVELALPGGRWDEVVEHHVGVDPSGGRLRALVPGVGWHQVRFPGRDPVRLREDVGDRIEVTVTPG